jgi:hypothetical protein
VDALVLLAESGGRGARAVGARIVDHQHLVIDGLALEHLRRPSYRPLDGADLVASRDDD